MKFAVLPCLLLLAAATCVLATKTTNEPAHLYFRTDSLKRESFEVASDTTSQLKARAGGFLKKLKGCVACGALPNGASTSSPPRRGQSRSPRGHVEERPSPSPSRQGSRSPSPAPSPAPPPQRHKDVIATPNNRKLLNFPPSTSGVVRLPQGDLQFMHNWPKK
ncbi:hypothetical protein BCV69DRAFT_275767 [Microstroma glucosiphilum]|uniref:Uncharacterized protein n=1 Tax=Pseudomicrostroma glucosiphilum TaxID=1684307 RepID=A0A316UDC4_9BASI|nr:hypothetical protein BCV69DRAFT_275767 [Pseudomicrostroma glucosiphilum]PWN22888.1 hypothetical protein BCV69DRAFT_275767 [Pseudomicrostroma glucosiphilum]